MVNNIPSIDLQFYFRLDSIRREIDHVRQDFDPSANLMAKNYGRVELVARRIQAALGPALAAFAFPI